MLTFPSLPLINISDFLSAERTLNAVQASSKKKALETIAKTLSANISGLSENALFDQLVQREKLGSTAIGHGCAVPHCHADGISQIYACFLKLDSTIDFDSPDNQKVDLIFAIIVPTDANDIYLNILARISQSLHEEEFRQQLRHAESNETLYQLLTKI